MTLLVLVFVVAIFGVLPDDVDESIDLGISGLETLPIPGDIETGGPALAIVPFSQGSELAAVVAGTARAWRVEDRTVTVPEGQRPTLPDGAREIDISIGLAFPGDFVSAARAGRFTTVTVSVNGDVPEEIRYAMSGLVREMAFAVAGDDLPVDIPQQDQVYVVLGEDRVGDQRTARDGFRPIFVFVVLVMEMFVMASLIAKEIQDRAVTAMLVTPATVGDVLAAKGISGAISGMAQAIVVLLAIDAMGTRPLLLLTFMLLGSVMVSGTAMIAGSTGEDFIGTLFNGMAFMIPLMIPAFGALFPGTPSAWIRALPSYPLVQGLVDVTTYGDGWPDTIPQLVTLSGWCVVLFGLGWLVLSRKLQSL